MSDVRRDRIASGIKAGLLDAKDLLGGVFVRKTKLQRNAIGPGYRSLDGNYTTLCYISSERALYELIANPGTEETTDSDWLRVLTVASGLTPLGTWNIDNANPELQDDMDGMEDLNGNFYFVTGASTPTPINIPGLFGDETVTVKDGDLIVSNGEVWFVNPINISWDTLDKPQVIIDYVNGSVITHTHAIDDVVGLQDALDQKYDEDDVAPLDEDFGAIPDVMLINLGFLKQYYLLATDTYSKAEIDSFFDALEDYYTKDEIDSLFDTQFTDIQSWVNTNFYDKETVDAKIADALEGIDGTIIGETNLAGRNALAGGDAVNGYTLEAGHRMLVTDTGGRFVDKFTGAAGETGASFWTRIYQYDREGRAIRIMGNFSASDGVYPEPPTLTGSGLEGAIEQGNVWINTADGEINGMFYAEGALLMAKIDAPGQTTLNWTTL